jgi:TnpA family transposase
MPPAHPVSPSNEPRLFAIPSDSVEMVRHYVLGAEDLALIRTKRRSINRLGFAVQLCLLWYPGLGMGPAEQPPEGMIAFVARSTRRAVRRLRRLSAAGIRLAANMRSNCKDTDTRTTVDLASWVAS